MQFMVVVAEFCVFRKQERGGGWFSKAGVPEIGGFQV